MELDCLLWMLPVTLLGFMFPGCLCCESCEVFSDDFDRSNDTDLGADWTEDSGSWAIDTNTLNTTSTSAVCTCDTAHPDATPHAFVSLNCRGPTNCILRIILDYQDTSNYHFAEVQVGSSKLVEIYKRSGGTNSLLDSATVSTTANTNFLFEACFQEGRISARAVLAVVSKSSTAIGGTKTGVGTGTTVGGTGARFEDFTFIKSFDATDSPSCPVCRATCCASPPEEYQVVFSDFGASACCQAIEGTYIVPFDLDNGTLCFWELADTGIAVACGTSPELKIDVPGPGAARMKVSFPGMAPQGDWRITTGVPCTYSNQAIPLVAGATTGCGSPIGTETCTVTALL